jgi:ribosome-binding ATPase YchF (GTP1/OBG family)
VSPPVPGGSDPLPAVGVERGEGTCGRTPSDGAVELGIVGKPNVGKSTFFSAATLAPAQIANYPFTTIEPNRGVAFVRVPCPHVEIGKPCAPVHGTCHDGKRFVPVDVLDVAGLVPKAHEGRGLGNKFLDDLRQAAAFIHVVDASGGTDFEGNPVKPGTHDPLEDVRFLEEELAHWVRGILARDFDRIARRAELEETPMERVLHERLAGLGVTEAQIHLALGDAAVDARPTKWTPEDMLRLASRVLRRGKPMMLAANKADLTPPEAIERIVKGAGAIVVPTAAEFELALRRAAKAGLILYEPGASSFRVVDPGKLTPAQLAGLKRIESFLLDRGSTGVQAAIEEAVRRLLNLIVVFPVEDETHWTDKKGNVLPDAFLVPRGATAKDLAFRVHTDLGKGFIRAINARTRMVVGHDHAVQDGDVIKIVAKT